MTTRTKQLAVHFPAGGTCKSTSTWALASYLSLKFRVLCIDLDPQSSLTNSLVEELGDTTAYEVLTKKADIDDAIMPTSPEYPENLFIISGSSKLSGLEVETAANIERHYLLSDSLDGLTDFDFILVDTPPNTGINSVASLTGSHVLVPVELSPKAWDQIPSFESLYKQVTRRINPTLEILGIVPTKYDHTNLARETLEALREKYGSLVTEPILKTVRIPEVMAQGLPPWKQEKSQDYLNLCNELLRRWKYGKEEEISAADCRSEGR